MPDVDQELFLEAVKKLVLLEKDWIPRGEGTSLYIRPTMIATEAALGVHPASEYLFFIVVGPVGSYYPEGFGPTKIFVCEEFVRSVRGGTGSSKAGGNYAASLYACNIACKMGFTQERFRLSMVSSKPTARVNICVPWRRTQRMVAPTVSNSAS